MLAHLSKQCRRDPLLGEEPEHSCSPVMAHGVVRGAGPTRGAFAERHGPGGAVGELRELAVPTGDHGEPIERRRHAQEAVALTELAVLVATAGDERAGEAL